ncbi:hypothetical protein AX17_006657 [Amanita inopinata Kibby_2008]|nr:hypothetical protein AX17_006657 [Amanita inopinata Kibby_2008]
MTLTTRVPAPISPTSIPPSPPLNLIKSLTLSRTTAAILAFTTTTLPCHTSSPSLTHLSLNELRLVPVLVLVVEPEEDVELDTAELADTEEEDLEREFDRDLAIGFRDRRVDFDKLTEPGGSRQGSSQDGQSPVEVPALNHYKRKKLASSR